MRVALDFEMLTVEFDFILQDKVMEYSWYPFQYIIFFK
jgi:hypothetical protein